MTSSRVMPIPLSLSVRVRFSYQMPDARAVRRRLHTAQGWTARESAVCQPHRKRWRSTHAGKFLCLNTENGSSDEEVVLLQTGIRVSLVLSYSSNYLNPDTVIDQIRR